MGRIAEALKKAETERREKVRLGTIPHRPISPLRTAPATPGVPTVSLPREIPAPIAPEPASPVVNDWGVHPSLVTITDRASTIAEQYRSVRTWLLSRITPGERSCLAITSSVPREGKSITTANLAVVFAEVRHMQVLAVDCDLRQGSLSKLFKLPVRAGLADVLSGRATLQDAIARTPIGNLSVLPAGSCAHPSPTELLNSTTTSRLFDELRDRYQYVLVDTPAVQRVSDVGVIGALCTGVLMVVRMHQTASHVVRQSVRCLQSNNLNVLGCK